MRNALQAGKSFPTGIKNFENNLRHKMMKKVIVFIVMLATPLLLLSQEVIKYEYTPKVKKQIEINDLLGKITFKNSGNNAIVIESDYKMERPERAEGLQSLVAMEDNTGLGISVTEENGEFLYFLF